MLLHSEIFFASLSPRLLNLSTPKCRNFLIEITLLKVDLRKIAAKIGEFISHAMLLFHFDAIFLIIDIHEEQSIHRNPL